MATLGRQTKVRVRSREALAIAMLIARKGRTDSFAARLQTAFALAPPSGPWRAVASDLALIGTGRNQWLAVWEGGGDPNAFVAQLRVTVAGTASVVDQSDSSAVLELTGPSVREVLAKGVPVDLHSRVFGPGNSATTSIALIAARLWQRDDAPTYDIVIPRSQVGSFLDWLTSSAAA